jgi:hypothetical protein
MPEQVLLSKCQTAQVLSISIRTLDKTHPVEKTPRTQDRSASSHIPIGNRAVCVGAREMKDPGTQNIPKRRRVEGGEGAEREQ